MQDRQLPFVLGMECVGQVTANGTESPIFRIGQRVICYDVTGGMYRKTIRVSPEKCFPIPHNVDSRTAAALFVNYLTAYFAVFYSASLKRDEEILIESCAGGVGWAATQFAKTVEGVRVFGTASTWKTADVIANGVDVVIPQEHLDVELDKYSFDCIIANQSGQMLKRFQGRLKQLGRLVMLGASNIIRDENKLTALDLLKLWWQTEYVKPIDLVMNSTSVSGLHLAILLEKEPDKVKKALKTIFSLVERGKVKPKIHSVWNFEDIVEATKVLAERRNVGKVLIKMI